MLGAVLRTARGRVGSSSPVPRVGSSPNPAARTQAALLLAPSRAKHATAVTGDSIVRSFFAWLY